MANVQLERTLVKSAPELWDELATGRALGRRLGEIQIGATEPPHRLEWSSDVARGVIELEASGWGTRIRAQADTAPGPAWERLQGRYALEASLRRLLDDLAATSLTSR
jgi:hypothetical protein